MGKKRKRGGSGGRYRGITWNLPEPAWKLFVEAQNAFLTFRRETQPSFEIGEQDFAIHLLVQGAREVHRAIAVERGKDNLVKPALQVPKQWPPDVQKRLDLIHAKQ